MSSEKHDAFLDICRVTVDNMSPKKTEHLRSNQSPFMYEKISKAIIVSFRFRNKFLKSRSVEVKARTMAYLLSVKLRGTFEESLNI